VGEQSQCHCRQDFDDQFDQIVSNALNRDIEPRGSRRTFILAVLLNDRNWVMLAD